MNNTITEIKNTLEGINRITEAEEQISELEDKMVEITAREQKKEKRKKRIEDSLRLSGTCEAETAGCCHSPVMGRDLGAVTHL